MTKSFDLFGDPIPEGFGKRGRPPHVVTAATKAKVILLMAIGRKDYEIALALGISEPTLRKNYREQLRSREEAKFKLEASRLLKLYEQVEEGNVAAIKEMGKVQERAEIDSGPYAQRQAKVTKAEKPAKIGKKEQANIDARSPDADSAMGRLIAARQQKQSLN
ncbi:hypothetical protein [Rhizobium sp. L51/94]|uniref:hypothetical protein n=1 Tax=Rhizobium sp. L51/94 TaxID=2819999 RepID=UPI001C5ADCAF|nr:hypothetical protein [Rhizobium sp. L51/94]QXZ79651.1 hypothetical protein J5274_06625 [Rhizobium sp. L51/94]